MEDDGDDKDDSKRKSRNLSEKKRRDQFNSLVNDLSALISTSNRKMDKSTVLKSTIAFLKHHNEATDRSKVFEIQQDWKPSFLTNDEFTHLMLESLDGFIIVFNSSGAIFYASESITSLLGYLPSDLLNVSIFDLSYEIDHECLFNIFLNPKPVIEPLQTDITSSNQISFYVHLKRGGIEKVDANAYELVKFVGYFRNDVNLESLPLPASQQLQSTPPRVFQMHPTINLDHKLIFVGTGRIQTPQLIREMSAIDPTRNEFTSKHSMEWKFLFLDHRAPPIIGYMPFEVLGTSGYDYYHFDDLDSIVACHEELMQKGEGKSCYYRFLTKGQQWIWLQTDFYVSYHQFNAKPDYVVCTHKVVSYADVIRKSKSGSRDGQVLPTAKSTASSNQSTTLTLGDFESPAPSQSLPIDDTQVQLSTATTNTCNVNTSGSLTNEVAGVIDISSMWGNANSAGLSTSQPQLPSQLKSSRPGSSYGNISSTGISPTIKRKRYLHSSRDNESDSTSISAESGTSKQSLMTHLSSNRQRHSLINNSHLSNHYLQHQHHSNNMHSQLSIQTSQMSSFHHAHPHLPVQTQAHSHPLPSTGSPTQKIIPVLQPHSMPPTPMIANNTCQYSQPSFTSLRNQQIVSSTFIEPPQYLTAIPVQPVIAPFPVAPVLSPIAVGNLALGVQNQSEMLSSAVVISPTQSQLQDQLQKKHDELQKLIMQQQDELRIVSEQLLLARYTLLQPVMPMTGCNNTPSPSTPTSLPIGHAGRGYNFASNNGGMESQFNQYGFTMNSDPMTNHQDPHMMMQQQLQQHQTQHQQQNLSSTQQLQQQLSHASLSQQQVQVQGQQATASPSQQLPPQQQTQVSFLSRSVPDLDQFGQEDIDAFLSLSPLQSIEGSQTGLSQITASGQNNTSNNLNVSHNVQSPLSQSYVHNSNATTVTTPNEDSLLSYMQMAAESSPALNFQIGISDDGSETQSEDTKLMPHPPQPDQQQSQASSFFTTNTFPSIGSQTQSANSTTANNLPNDLEIHPYQMSQEQSQNLFNSPPNSTGTNQ